jgi:DnaJ-domain-containing protein 1
MGRLLVLLLITVCIVIAVRTLRDVLQKPATRPRPSQSQGRRSGHGTERHYRQVLGISETATPEEIKAAYRSQLAKYHPDKVNHMADEFRDLADSRTKEINEAFAYFKQKYGFR